MTDKIDTWAIAKTLTSDEFAELLDDYLNLGGKQMPEGEKVGLYLRGTHRTLQRQAIAFCLGVIMGLADQTYTDLRNEQAIATAKRIKEMVWDGDLPVGGYV